MSPGVEILLCGLAAFGLPVAFGMRVVVGTRRPPPIGGGEGGVVPEPDAPRPNLPDCLIPRRDTLARAPEHEREHEREREHEPV